jgi:hypothetical protein
MVPNKGEFFCEREYIFSCWRDYLTKGVTFSKEENLFKMPQVFFTLPTFFKCLPFQRFDSKGG